MKTVELEKEIGGLQRRREALAVEAAGAQRELAAARQNLVDAKVDVAEVTAAQATHTALTEALGSVDAQLEDLRAQLSDAQTVELREEKMRDMVDLAAEATAAFADYQQVRAEADAALAAIAERMAFHQAAIQQKRKRFLELFTTFCPHAAMHSGWSDPNQERMRAEDLAAKRLIDDLRERGADLAAVRSDLFGASSQIDCEDLAQRTVALEPLAFAGLFQQIATTAEYVRRQANPSAEAHSRVTGKGLPSGWNSKAA